MLAVAASASVTTIAGTLGLHHSLFVGNCDAPLSHASTPSNSDPASSSPISVDADGIDVNDHNKDSSGERNKSIDGEPSLEWKAVVRVLRETQRSELSGAGFRAVRRPMTTDSSNNTNKSTNSATPGWVHDFEFPLLTDADLYGVLVALAHGLGGAGAHESSIRVEESGTRRQIILSRDKQFEAKVSVPRVTSLHGRVSIHIWKGAHEGFTNDEMHGLVNAYRSSRRSLNEIYAPVQSSSPHILDGKFSVDIGPPTFRETPPPGPKTKSEGRFRDDRGKQSTEQSRRVKQEARQKLEQMGIEVFDINEDDDEDDDDGSRKKKLTWDALAGYADVKQRIEDTLTLPLLHPEVYESIVRGTRKRAETNVPKAVLYEGPPGCGKTLSARILAASIGIPFVHVRVETLLSKFYGETTRKMSDVLETANQLGRCIVFLDECDSVGLRRSSSTDSGGGGSGAGNNDVHEVTRRTLSVLLRFIDGMDGAKDAIILAATNHKEDLDAALVSRFDVIVSFPLPDLDTRVAMLRLYAKQLSQEDLMRVATMTWGFSGRELVDVCEEAERTKAGDVLRKKFQSHDNTMTTQGQGRYVNAIDDEDDLKLGEFGGGDGDDNNDDVVVVALPEVQDYLDAVDRKAAHVVGRWNGRFADRETLQALVREVNKGDETPQSNPSISVSPMEQSRDRGPTPISTES